VSTPDKNYEEQRRQHEAQEIADFLKEAKRLGIPVGAPPSTTEPTFPQEFRDLVAWAWTALEKLPPSKKFNADVVRRADAALRAQASATRPTLIEGLLSQDGIGRAELIFAVVDLLLEDVASDPSKLKRAQEVARRDISPYLSPTFIGIDKGRPGGDFTGYACSCGQVRVSPDGPCEQKDCPIRATTDGGGA
jgi:hypothetical protein